MYKYLNIYFVNDFSIAELHNSGILAASNILNAIYYTYMYRH